MRAGIWCIWSSCPTDGSDPIHNYGLIRKELEQYSQELAVRPEIPVVTKAELPGAEVRDSMQNLIGTDVLLIMPQSPVLD